MTPSPQARSSAEKVNGKPPARAAFCIQNAAVAAFRMRRAVAPRAISFPSCGKRYGRKGRWRREIALSRRKNLSLRCACCRYAVRSPNALRAAAQLGFPSAQHAIQIVLFAPVEYLTYGSRKNVLFSRTAVRIAHRRTAIQVAAEIAAEYFDDLAGLSNTHLYRVLQI